jgi:hypothetical protein
MRTFSHTIHVSLHKSGVWKFDINSERHYLNKEICIADGWGMGPALVFPTLKTKGFEFLERNLSDKKVITLPSAPLHEIRVIQLLFQRRTGGFSLEEVIPDFIRDKIDWHEWIELKTMGTLHIVSYLAVPEKERLDYFYSIKEKTKFTLNRTPEPAERFGGNMMMFETPKDASIRSVIISVPLEIDNCQIEQTTLPDNPAPPNAKASSGG